MSQVNRKLLERKIEFLQQELILATDGSVKFKLKEEIAELESELQKLISARNQVPELQIETTRYPSISNKLYGRTEELQLLDDAWENPNLRVLSFIAMGGTGKTALIHEWMNRMRDDHWRGAKRVYAWSFYSQGASEDRQASSDAFINEALQFFGDAELAASPASGYEKGKRLAARFGESRTLLLLDGLEPLQYPPGPMHGKLKDQGMAALLKGILNQEQGLCVLSSRIAVSELENKGKRSHSYDLQQLDDNTGAQLLEQQYGLYPKKQLIPTVQEYQGHALALNLLGSYLKVAYNGDLHKRKEIPDLFEEEKNGGQAMRVMQSYARYFKDKPELEVLYLLGLFDRPVEIEVVELLRKEAISGISEVISQQSDYKWKNTLKHLRDLKLLNDEKIFLDCHPLIRTYFGRQLKKEQSEAWKAAHLQLYKYYTQKQKKYLPDTLEEMKPLFLAVRHGCLAGKHKDCYDTLFMTRMLRGNDYYLIRNLCGFNQMLTFLNNFFEKLWIIPHHNLPHYDRVVLLNLVSLSLRSIGRIQESIILMQNALKIRLQEKKWREAAINGRNVTEIFLLLGNIDKAIEFGQKTLQYARKQDDYLQQEIAKTSLANAYFHAGNFVKSIELFQDAETQSNKRGGFFLHSYRGFLYCEFLFETKKLKQILLRSCISIEMERGNILMSALNHIPKSRILFLNNQLEACFKDINYSINSVKNSNTQEFLPLGLLARTTYHRETQNYLAAWEDLEEVLEIAEYGGMRLYLTDYYLEAARVLRHQEAHMAAPYRILQVGEQRALTQADAQAQYQAWVAEAAQLIQDTGYHRRDKELEDLQNNTI